MGLHAQAIDAASKNASLLASAGSGAGAWLVFDASIWVAIAAFAGAGLILSFLPRREGDRVRTLGTVVLCTVLGILAGPLLIKYADPLRGFDSLTAFSIAALAQILIPLAIENKTEIWKWAVGMLPGQRRADDRGDKK